MPYAGNTAPSGWLMCGGQLVSRATYAALFAIIGTTYGSGDGSTTFALPDLRGRVVAGRDNMGGNGSANRLTDKAGGLNGDILGDAGGSEVHTLVVDELPKHSHSFTYSEDQDVNAGGSSLPIKDMATTGLAKTLKTQDAGANAAHNNVQPTLILNYMIKT
jgi:microcystin-dependent protein